MGANRTTVASILERCPEAILQPPEVIKAQQHLWRSVYSNDKDLVKTIERFPGSFFTFIHKENQTRNIQYFQELGLKKKIISRFLASAPDIFCNSVDKNKGMIEALQESYLQLGGSEANMKVWLVKLLCQDPFILSKSPGKVRNNLESFQRLGFTDSEALRLLSKLKGFISDVTGNSMESSAVYTKNIFKCNDEELKEMVLKCPALLYYTVPVLRERLEGLLTEGISIEQIKYSPSVLELTTQIVQYRIKTLFGLGYNVKDVHLEQLIGTKKDFEVSLTKIQPKRQRPLFNPVAPLDLDN
ncbi:hypothetical protein NDU88_005763 [Pleurodeles waltl]|uniref:Mitochondrial transcription termination factor 2 n=2 Tax=Pleurodeles waltl TaxID=8319 RepID=A0AAV7SMQ5_PLEWA|nr:hypothetical protein NDU88_005763 [Pleurodeles waltl]